MKNITIEAKITAKISLIFDLLESTSGNTDKKELKNTKKIRSK
jgi:hypothetical protein